MRTTATMTTLHLLPCCCWLFLLLWCCVVLQQPLPVHATTTTTFSSVVTHEEEVEEAKHEMSHGLLRQKQEPLQDLVVVGEQPFDRRHPDQQRNLLFWTFFCEFGFPPILCICKTSQLESAIDDGDSNIRICPGSNIQLSQTLDVTNYDGTIECWSTLFDKSECTISGKGLYRLFTGKPSQLTLKDLTLTGGNAQNSNIVKRGGVLYVTTGTVIFENCLLHDNRAESGGAISVEGSSTVVQIKDSVIRDHDDDLIQSGGAIYAFREATVQISDSILRNNVASDGSGGAIYADDAFITLSNCRLENNRAILPTGTGGAIFSFKSKMNLADTVFLNNQAGQDAGAIFSGRDIYIADNLQPAVDGSNVQCGLALPVTFCNSTEGIIESGGPVPKNTDCDVKGQEGDDVDPEVCKPT